jgi:predicted GTPase
VLGTSRTNRDALTDKAWQGLGEYLQRKSTRLLATECRETMLSEWWTITDQENSLEDAILIGLVGGTGVGKSTLINALASAEISRSGDRRPTTNRVVVYRNVASDLPPEIPTQHFAQPQVLHEKENLSKVILFDFPDFDSAEASHAAILAEYLPHLDVLFIIVDDVKYGDRRLYDLLAGLTHDKRNMFVLLNKVDRLATRYGEKAPQVAEEILADMREKLAEHAQIAIGKDQQFAIAAKPVLQARLDGGSSPNVDVIEKVEELLESFQKDKHRRAAKERNLDARKQALLDEIHQFALGPENRAIIDESRELVAKWRSETENASAAIPVEILLDRERRALRIRRMRGVAAKWGFPTSLLVTLLSEIRRWRGNADGAQPANIGVRIHHHYRAFFESLANLRARIASEVAGTALADGRPADRNDGTEGVKIESPEAVTNRLGREFEIRLARREQRPRRMSRWLCHGPAILVVGLAIWSRIYPLLDSIRGSSDRGFFATLVRTVWTTLSPSFLIGIGFSVVLAYLASAIFVWIREIQILDAEIADGEQEVREQIRKHGEQVISAIDGRVQSLHDEFEQLSRVIQ